MSRRHVLHLVEKKIKKTVYLGHRKFLSRLPKRRPHPYQKMTKEFNGKIKNDRAPVPLTGVQMFEKLKDKNVEFGKRKQKKSKEEKQKEKEEIWKKRSIFWDLDY
jgi:Transposase family tnp2